MSRWQANAVAPDNSHINFYYDRTSSSGLIYNLYADKLLQLNLVPDSVYDVMTSYYDRMAGKLATDQYGSRPILTGFRLDDLWASS